MVFQNRDIIGESDNAAPSVIGSHDFDTQDDDRPDTAYLPSERVTGRDQNITLELRRLTDGRVALLAFSSLELLVEGCGNRQPWVAVQSHLLEDMKFRSGADLVLWDAAIPIEERRSGVEGDS